MKRIYLIVLLLFSLGMIVILQFGFIFLMVAMLPSFVAYFIDPQPDKPRFKVVLNCNIAATFPMLAPMFEASIHFQPYDITVLVSNPNIWVFIYGGAAIGWCLIYLCGQLAQYIVGARNEFLIYQIEEQQQKLVDEWGPDIKDPPAPPKKSESIAK